jgi:hypothetical protein
MGNKLTMRARYRKTIGWYSSPSVGLVLGKRICFIWCSPLLVMLPYKFIRPIFLARFDIPENSLP